jgi:ABC-type phosphate transport system auxiliary subunit
MDSSFIANEREEYQIKEKIDDKARKELTAELDGLKAEFKRLQGEVGRLKKEKGIPR